MSAVTRMPPADVAAHVAAQDPVRTAPLPPAARVALRMLGLRLAHPAAVVEAVVAYEVAAVHAADLAAQAATGRNLPEVDVRSWEFAEELMAGALAVLAKFGLAHLVSSASWRCVDCDTYNGSGDGVCMTCGGPKSGVLAVSAIGGV